MRLLFAFFVLIFPLAAKPPNVVIFLADDQGWGDLSHSGNPDLDTPRIDSLAEQGASFDRFFVCPVCAPTRAEFLTGRHFARTGVRGVTAGQERLNADEQTIAEVFRKAGYATGIFGKWHNGTQAPYHPNSRGFDEFYGFTSGHWGHYFSPTLEHNDQIVKGEGYVTDDFTSKAIDFITENKEKPFFCYVPYCTPHSPMQVPDEFWQRFAEKEITSAPGGKADAHYRAALAMVENIDWNVGRVLDRLDELKIADNTIVIYFSDNGPNGNRWRGGMKGTKGSLEDGGTRTPFFVRWPARIKAGLTIKPNAAAIDMLPTLAAAAGIELDPPKPLDGKDLTPLLFGETTELPERMLFVNHGRGDGVRWGLREGRYRYYFNGQLHDIETDPGQNKNLAKENPELAARLKAAGEAYMAEVGEDLRKPDPRPNPVGVEPVTHLPARDGNGKQGVTWSSRHPNCSFFVNWNSTGQSIVWPVEIAEPGNYEAILHYTCPEDSTGSEIELSYGDSSTKAVIDKAFDPPLLGKAEDRSPRQESYYKDFTPLSLGTLKLPAGKGEFVLRATKIPGKHVADVRWLVLKRNP